MSFREEDDEREKSCPSRSVGLGVAVAAIGVGVGAALYYFMNKRPANPNTAGSTTQNWTCEPDHALNNNTQLRRDEAFRKRSWTLEECSICFDVILRDQEVMTLPCTHHFHSKCIMPWIQEQQTCPNCRKPIDG